jgi:hypothetical protein
VGFKFERERFLLRFLKDLNMHFAILDIDEKSDEHGSYIVSNDDHRVRFKYPSINRQLAKFFSRVICVVYSKTVVLFLNSSLL